jgi:hypothetical protein
VLTPATRRSENENKEQRDFAPFEKHCHAVSAVLTST